MICSKCLNIRYEGKPNASTIEEMIRLDKMAEQQKHINIPFIA